MSVLKLKMEVLEKVMQTEDESILAQLKRILSSNTNANFGEDFSPEQLESIKRGKEQLKEGKGIPMEKFMEKLQNRNR